MLRLNSTRLIYLPKMLAVLLALAALALSGCFHSDDDDPAPVPNANPTGYYTNSGFVDVKAADNTTQRLVQDVQGMVADGQLMILSDEQNLAYIGTFTVSGNDFSGSVTVYEAGVMVQEDVPVTGMITATSKITGTLGGIGVANGIFQLDYAADNEAVNLEMLERDFSWKPVVNQNIPSLNLKSITAPDPAFNFNSSGTGSNVFEGCAYRGRMEPIADTHLYTVSVTMSSCDGQGTGVDAVPKYTGLASVRGTNPDRFVLVLTNGIYDFSGEYFECLVLFCTPQ